MTEPLEQKAQESFDKGKVDALAGKSPCIRDFVDNVSVQNYFSGFGEGTAERKGINEKEKRLYALLFSKGLSDANAGHSPSNFSDAYLGGFWKGRRYCHCEEEDAELDYINEIRWDYDLPPITRQDLMRDD